MSIDTLEALVALQFIPFLGPSKIKELVTLFGSPKNVFNASVEDIFIQKGIGPKIRENWTHSLQSGLWEAEMELARKHSIHIISYLDPRYPKQLKEIIDFPILLYVKGESKLEERSTEDSLFAIVGTRQATIYGLESAKTISASLARSGLTIVSGLARGIDTAVHKGALEQGKTIAVIGSGLLHIYPTENIPLAKKIAESGAVISEFPLKTPPEKYNFPKRNRIISGLSLGTLVIEAPVKSGAMLTADRALEQGRPLFALPGRTDMETFSGNHQLIKHKKATLIENYQDILSYFNKSSSSQDPCKKSINEASLTPEEKQLLEKLPSREVCLDSILMIYPYEVAKLCGLLMSLVLKKKIKEYPGKIYKKI